VVVLAVLASLAISATAIAAAGDLDPTFSGDGRQTTDFSPGSRDTANGVAIQSDGKIVVVGYTPVDHGDTSHLNTNDDFALARYNPNGTLDTTFSGDGKQTTDFGGEDQAYGVAIQPNAKIVVVGVDFNNSTGNGGDFVLARYNPNGSLDTSFSGDGEQAIGSDGDAAAAVAIQPNGKIVAVGPCCGVRDVGERFLIARFNANGSLDPTFAGDGTQMTSFRNSSVADAVAIQANGKIVVAGETTNDAFNGTRDYALARYNPNGTLDTSFSGDGKQVTSIEGQAYGVGIQSSGKIVVVGSGGTSAIARYNPNGSRDTKFAGDGSAAFGDSANAVVIQANDKIVVVGGGTLARYNANGSRDTSFSGDGSAGFDGRASAVSLQANGRIVVAGYSFDGSDYDFALARYLGG
jgi:uncharacterized delta-60 repeat protein